MSNPLLDKFYEIYPEKKEKLKNDTLTNFTSVASNSTTPSVATPNTSNTKASTGITKASSFITHDKDSGNDAFLQIAEKVKNGTAQVTSVSLQVDAHGVFSYGKRITFEVYDYEP